LISQAVTLIQAALQIVDWLSGKKFGQVQIADTASPEAVLKACHIVRGRLKKHHIKRNKRQMGDLVLGYIDRAEMTCMVEDHMINLVENLHDLFPEIALAGTPQEILSQATSSYKEIFRTELMETSSGLRELTDSIDTAKAVRNLGNIPLEIPIFLRALFTANREKAEGSMRHLIVNSVVKFGKRSSGLMPSEISRPFHNKDKEGLGLFSTLILISPGKKNQNAISPAPAASAPRAFV
jgi:hypothetical protein